MSQHIEPLDVNVFIISDCKPDKDDADANGQVLYYSPDIGWYQGYFYKPHMTGTTHWTYLPKRPPSLEDPTIQRDKKFNEWLVTFPTKFEDAVVALFRLSWNAAWERARNQA